MLLSRKPCGHVKSLEKNLGGRGEGKRAIFEFRSKTIHGTLVMHPPPPTAFQSFQFFQFPVLFVFRLAANCQLDDLD